MVFCEVREADGRLSVGTSVLFEEGGFQSRDNFIVGGKGCDYAGTPKTVSIEVSLSILRAVCPLCSVSGLFRTAGEES